MSEKYIDLEAINVSPFHSEAVASAARHLAGRQTSTGNIPPVLLSELRQVWDSPAAIATHRHNKLDPRLKLLVGDTIVGHLAACAPTAVVHNLIWETHPKGVDTIKITLPTQNGIKTSLIGENLPNFTQWRPAAEALPAIRKNLSWPNWEKLSEHTKTMGLLYHTYEAALSSSSGTLTELMIHIEKTVFALLVGEVIGYHTTEAQPYSSSPLISQVTRTLLILDKHLGLENILDLAVDEHTAANLFVGGTHDRLTRIGYSTKKRRFQITEVDLYLPSLKTKDRKPITKEEVFSLLSTGDVIPAGIPAFIALIAASLVAPIAHYGNEYDSVDKISRSLRVDRPQGYIQVVPDNSDAWPPATADTQSLTASSLVLWQALYQINVQQIVADSIKSGRSLDISHYAS